MKWLLSLLKARDTVAATGAHSLLFDRSLAFRVLILAGLFASAILVTGQRAEAHALIFQLTGPDSVTSRPSSQVAPVAIRVMNFSYSPSSFSAQAGQPIIVNVTNAGPAPHTFTINGVTDSGSIASGSSRTVQFTVAQPGTLTFYCTIHGQNVMSGQIAVQPASAPAQPAAPQAAPQQVPSGPVNPPLVPPMRPPSTGDAGLLAEAS